MFKKTMTEDKLVLHTFLVKSFNSVLRREEKSLEKFCDGKISVKEFHVIEQIGAAKNGKNSMGDIAGALDITIGTLTVAVKTLVAKGLVKREACENDKRSMRLSLTPLGEECDKTHTKFHEELVDKIYNKLNKQEQKVLAESLEVVQKFFKEKNE